VSLPHVLLGLLSGEPKTGYELARAMESDLAAIWSAGFSQIYPALARLRRIGWVRLRTLGPRRGPPRLLYRVTAAGRRELFRWLSSPPSAERRHDSLLARVAFLDLLPPAERRRALAGMDAAIAAEASGWASSPESEGSVGFARRAAVEERDALRRFLLRAATREVREPAPEKPIPPRPPRRTPAAARRPRPPVRRRG
jgi:DNA-binding PadR family transcriptional regulator